MLVRKLQELSGSNVYPFHMPGHKRQIDFDFMNPYRIDITEIEGFDNLHRAVDVLKEEQDRGARIYGSEKCYFLVNGSTCGILSAISAVTKRRERVLIARNCHKAVYHAVELRQLIAEYVYPVDTDSGLQGQISVSSVQEALDKHRDIRVVVLTSPTYDGIVSDVKSIAELVHKRGGILIVDEAHGAHFGFHPAFPENATGLGADIVVMSVHKTLAAFTQTALLHICSRRVSPQMVERFLGIYETSSPSYVLMAGISGCMRMLEKDSINGEMERYYGLLTAFHRCTEDLKKIKVYQAKDFSPEEAYAFDPGKLILSAAGAGLTGHALKDVLLRDYKLQMEMAGGDYVLAMTSICDSREGFERLERALHEIDGRCAGAPGQTGISSGKLYRGQEKVLELSDAVECERELLDLPQAVDRISASYISIYPPGIPLLVPGERIKEELISTLIFCREMGLDMQGLSKERWIEVVKSAEVYYN